MSCILPGALDAIRGASLFYPCAGRDWDEPLKLFSPAIVDYWFVDVAYFTATERGDASKPSLSGHPTLVFERFELEGPPVAKRQVLTDPSGCRYPYIEPCTRSEVYLDQVTGLQITIHRRRGFGERSIEQVSDIGVFFHRGDSHGEGGSNVHWLSNRWIQLVMERLRDGGLIVTDGSLADPRPLRKLNWTEVPPEKAFEQAKPFTKWGRRWTCVGWASSRYGPTLIWRTSAA